MDPPFTKSRVRVRTAYCACLCLAWLGCAPPHVVAEPSPTRRSTTAAHPPVARVESPADLAAAKPDQHPSPGAAEPPAQQDPSAPRGDVIFGPLPKDAYLDRLDRRGRLLSFCTRSSPTAAPSLFLARPEAPPEAVDAIFLVSPSGRYWIVLSNQTVRLVDAETGRSFDLSSRGAPHSPQHAGDLPRFAFSTDEKSLYYLNDSGSSLTTVSVASLDSSMVDSTLSLEATARGIRWAASYLQIVGPPRSSKARRHFHACESHERYLAGPDASDPDAGFRDSVWLWHPSEPHPFSAPGFVLAHLDGFVRRDGTGELLWVEGKTQKTLAPESCGGRILLTDAKSPLFLVSCEEYAPRDTRPRKSGKREKAPRLKFPIYLVAPSYSLDLNVELYRAGTDAPSEPDTIRKLFELRPASDVIWLSLGELRSTRAPSGSRLIAQTDEHLLVSSGESYSLLRQSDFPFTQGRATARPQSLPVLPLQNRQYRGAYFCAEQYCGNWERGIWMELAGRTVWHLDDDGSLLLARPEGAALYLSLGSLNSLSN